MDFRAIGAGVLIAGLAACGGGGITPATAAPLAVVTSGADLGSVAQNLIGQQRSDGAILSTSATVNPYFANVAATGAVHGGVDLINVRRWMQWYIVNSATPNPWSIPGAITDYTVAANGTLVSTGDADSVDAYAATFLTLAAAAWREGDGNLRAYILANRRAIERIASAIDAVSDTDGLTFASPRYRFKYLMDNSEVFHGLQDLATLRSQAFGDVAGSMQAAAHALQIQHAIQSRYWDASRGEFAIALDQYGAPAWPQAGKWLDGTAQLFPILHGVIDPLSSPAQTVYAQFSNAFPGWPTLQKPDPYPWVSVAFVALQMNDTGRAATFANAVQQQYVPNFGYPWYCTESGWYVRLLLGLQAPQTVASL